MQSNQFLYEIIFIDDGSTDSSWQVIEKLSRSNSSLKGIRSKTTENHRRWMQGLALLLERLLLPWTLIYRGPDEIPALYELITKDDFDLILDGRKDVMTMLLKIFLLNYLTGLLEKLLG